MNFSRSTIVEALLLLEHAPHSEITTYLIRFGLEDIAPPSLGSKRDRINALIRHFISNPLQTGPKGADIVLETIEFLLKSVVGYSGSGAVPALASSLRIDGYSIKPDGSLEAILPHVLPLATKKTEVESLLAKQQFFIPEGHLQQAISAYTRGDWASANAQIRSFIESLFDEFANRLVSAPLAPDSHGRREQLAKLSPPFIDPALNEWNAGSGTTGFVQGFWKRLHPAGSHPGLSDEDDSTFRMQLAYIVAHRFLKRFDAYP